MSEWHRYISCVAVVLVCVIACIHPAKADAPVVVAGSWSGYQVQRAVGDAFTKDCGVRVGVLGRNNSRGFEYLAEGKMGVLIYSPQSSMTTAEAMAKLFPKETPQPAKYTFGHFVVYVVVNKANTTAGLTYKELQGIYSGKIKDWKEVRAQAGRITLVGELIHSKSREIFRDKVLADSSLAPSEAALRDYNPSPPGHRRTVTRNQISYQLLALAG